MRAFALALALAACSRSDAPGPHPTVEAGEAGEAGVVEHVREPVREHVVTVVTDPAALTHLDAHGYSFAERFGPMSSARYKSLVSFIQRDVDAALARYEKKKPSIGTAKKTAREIDSKLAALNVAWLTSPALHYELVGVINRFDLRLLPERVVSCGEVRLVYRAAYTGPRESSRLPVTVIVAFPQAQDCSAAARSWTVDALPKGVALAQFLSEGPLRALGSPIAFELNALVEQWSRFVHEVDGVGAHHRYSLRVFRPAGDVLVEEPLINTPDVDAVVASPEKKRALLAWIGANRAAIDDGRASLGPLPGVGEVRAMQVSSFTAMGLTRAVNRPYSRIFRDDLEVFRTTLGLATALDAERVLRKLDMTTCNGCHVTRSVLGLHLPGEERDGAAYRDPEAHESELVVDADQPDGVPRDESGLPRKKAPAAARVTANRMAVGVSPHLRDELERRARDLRRFLVDGGFVAMPSPDRGALLRGGYGAPCASGELECNAGLRCVALDNSGYGQCIGRLAGDARSVGDPYELQTYALKTLWALADPFLDRGPVTALAKCIGGGETGRDRGFPFGGICAPVTGDSLFASRKEKDTGCRASDGVVPLGESAFVNEAGLVVTKGVTAGLTQGLGREVVCGLSPIRASKTWGFMSTAAMVWNSTAPAFLPACDLDHPCRDEYVCMRRLPRADRALRDPSSGTCVAGYVVASLEIDAHKVP